LVDGQNGWLADRIVGWWTEWLVGGQNGWLVDRMVGWWTE
jgi:hypothetical protein